MKGLLLLLPLLFIAGCGKYSSKAEALDACEKWDREEKGELIVRVHDYNGDTWLSQDHGVRWCKDEPETRQILGWGRPDYIPGKIIEKGDPYPERKVVTRYRY